MFNLQPKLDDDDQLPEKHSTNHQPSGGLDGDRATEEQSKSFNGLSTSEKSAADKQQTKPFGVDDQQSNNGQPPKKPNADGQSTKELDAADKQSKEQLVVCTIKKYWK